VIACAAPVDTPTIGRLPVGDPLRAGGGAVGGLVRGGGNVADPPRAGGGGDGGRVRATGPLGDATPVALETGTLGASMSVASSRGTPLLAIGGGDVGDPRRCGGGAIGGGAVSDPRRCGGGAVGGLVRGPAPVAVAGPLAGGAALGDAGRGMPVLAGPLA
jgi:hypothetical protein